ncbi:MAG: YqjD family protein [Gammaproteobacteria bacterium]
MIDAGAEYIAEAVRAARQRLDDLEEQVRDKAHDAARTTEYFVRKHPWQSVGLAAGIGLIVGVLINRR